jgi:hypothetical protein
MIKKSTGAGENDRCWNEDAIRIQLNAETSSGRHPYTGDTGHWRGHPRARAPKPPLFVAHGVTVHGPDSGSNFAWCVLRIRPFHWRPRTPREAMLSHVLSTMGAAKLRAVALNRRRPALALAVDPPKQARLPGSVLWVDCPGHELLTNLRCWPRRAQPRPCSGPHGAGG